MKVIGSGKDALLDNEMARSLEVPDGVALHNDYETVESNVLATSSKVKAGLDALQDNVDTGSILEKVAQQDNEDTMSLVALTFA